MQTTSPIRRYVILRRRDHGPAAAARWSMEKVAPEQSASAPVTTAQPSPAEGRVAYAKSS